MPTEPPARWRLRPPVVTGVPHAGAEALRVERLVGPIYARPGEGIATGIAGPRYPVQDALFAAAYAPADPEPPAATSGAAPGGSTPE